ncbi:APC family permease [Acinetobacter sp. ANC 5380]|jgi:putrescine importer|uniref:APC family permease n=1 Tax=Acinetobacter terrae TaxID=2731247 RepID=A0A7Y2WAP4_9GAMM|nr:APC family permease [Acinetobacter terrae]NNH14978.1 APC family permease [Acinetobacter terrae]NNH76893.1 APC family permease [Acinetobacter terrae]
MEKTQVSFKKMSLWQVVIIGIAYMTPMVVFDTFGIVSGITDGRVPMAYILALAAMLLTAFSYARFSRISDKSGSAYTYTAESCGAKAGFFVGWCSLLDYILLPLVNALLAGIYLEAVIPSVPYWVWVSLFAGLVTLINCFRINILANLSLIFVLAPLLLMGLFVYLVIQGVGSAQGYEHVLTVAPLFNGDTSILPLIAGASILCFSFLGFDAVTTMSHETKDPKRTIPRAVILTTLMGGAIFITASWFIQLYFPSNVRFNNPDEALPEIVLYVGGALFQAVFLCAQIMNTFASGLATHASASRLIHIMGKDGIFHKGTFGQLHSKLGTPLYAVLTIGFISLTAIALDLATVVSMISFGALIAFTAVNFSVFMKFYVLEQQREGFKNKFMNLILPLISVAVIMCLWFNLERSALLFGCAWLSIGVLIFLYKKLKKQNIVIGNAY